MLKIDYVITNGYVDAETIAKRAEKGWTFVATLPANLMHPYALPTDKITFFVRYEKQNLISEEEAVCNE
jgi:hypothetical protein